MRSWIMRAYHGATMLCAYGCVRFRSRSTSSASYTISYLARCLLSVHVDDTSILPQIKVEIEQSGLRSRLLQEPTQKLVLFRLRSRLVVPQTTGSPVCVSLHQSCLIAEDA